MNESDPQNLALVFYMFKAFCPFAGLGKATLWSTG